MASPAQRQLAAGIGSLTRWSRVHGADARREQLASARAGRLRGWEQQARDAGAVTPEEIPEAVDRLKSAHYRRMALASAASRRRSSGRVA
jgi:hypothetical protein